MQVAIQYEGEISGACIFILYLCMQEYDIVCACECKCDGFFMIILYNFLFIIMIIVYI